MKAVIYIRVSTEGQAVEGISLDAQQAKLEAWSVANEYEIISTHIDAGVSGCRADNRNELQKAIALACKEKAALVVYSLSRLARSTKDAIEIAEKLDRHGADLVSISEKLDSSCAAGKMIYRMIAVLAEFESDQISERTSLALQYKKSKNERTGAIPYGKQLHSDGIHLIENETEQRAIRLVRKLRNSGLSIRKIAARLNSEGVAARGRQWHPTTITRIMQNNANQI